MTDLDRARADAPAVTSLLRDGAFLRVWLTGGAAGVLRWLELLAISVYVLQTTGSPFLVALMTFLRMAPMFLFGIPAGALADRYDRKRLLLIGLLALAGAAARSHCSRCQGRIAIWHIAPGTFLNGMFWSTEFPVRRTMLGEIAGPARLSRAMALESATSNATRMVGPALGGVLIEATGLYGVYLLGALLYRSARPGPAARLPRRPAPGAALRSRHAARGLAVHPRASG